MQVGASPTDRIINHVQVKHTALPGAELQQFLCRAAYYLLGQGNTHCRSVLSCPDGCKNREALSQAASRVLGTPGHAVTHMFLHGFSSHGSTENLHSLFAISFYSTSAALLHLSKSSAFL